LRKVALLLNQVSFVEDVRRLEFRRRNATLNTKRYINSNNDDVNLLSKSVLWHSFNFEVQYYHGLLGLLSPLLVLQCSPEHSHVSVPKRPW
jgi:hypothetical protein